MVLVVALASGIVMAADIVEVYAEHQISDRVSI
jgi:hypothetical protein